MLEVLPGPFAADPLPRVSVVLPAGAAGNASAIWMGGARALRGEELHAAALASAWLVDAAGDMPHEHRQAVARLVHCVFADSEEVPPGFVRIQETVRTLALAARAADAPDHIYIVCAQGLNRSGLLTGLVLRELGLPGEDAVARIRAARAGALANHAYERLIHEARPWLRPLEG
jgi:hypothetical protein